MLLAMFVHWELSGTPHYPSMETGQRIAYISDVGAFELKPLFIAGSAVTCVFLDLGFASERYLRHTGRLIRNTSVTQKVLSVIGIFFACCGTAGLILLSVFDTNHHPNLHDYFLLLFLGGYIISAIFLCAEYQRLGIHYRNHRILRISFWTKLMFIVFEVILAIAFGATSYSSYQNVAAVLEWIVALVFTFYVLSFVIDLLPSVRTKRHTPQGLQEAEKGTLAGQNTSGSDQSYEQPLTNDSIGPNADTSSRYSGYRGVANTSVPQYPPQTHNTYRPADQYGDEALVYDHVTDERTGRPF